VDLVGFIIRIYLDARSFECQIEVELECKFRSQRNPVSRRIHAVRLSSSDSK